MSDILSQLNESQREAAGTTEGPVMIIAGAGSGKTRTLTYRIAYLVENGVDPFNILALTFTNKAAGEMKERIIKLVGTDARNIWMGTFHSVCARLLRSEAEKLGYSTSFTIYDTDDCKSLIKQIVKAMNLDAKVYSANFVIGRISSAKSNLLSPDDYINNPEIQQTDAAGKRPMIGEIYRSYNARLRAAMAMDFDDLLYNTNVLLRDFPEVLLKYQQRFRYIHVDEYQDTNYAQYLIVKKLAARYHNICVVGDDAQSIYAFRGANIQNILNFKRDYQSAKLFKLEQNYRSTKVIVNAANSIIENNKEQIKKEIWTDNAQGNLIKLITSVDERDEGSRVADSIAKAHLGDELEYKDVAILYRTNSQSRAIEEGLRRLTIPYRIYAGISFYGRKEVKTVLAYLRLVVNNHDDESLLRVINFPPRGIGQTTIDKIRVAASDNDISICTVLENLNSFGLPLAQATAQKIDAFISQIKRFSSQVPTVDAFTLAQQVVHATGIVKHLQSDDDPENANRIENIEELLNGIQEFCQSDETVAPGETDQLRTLDQFLQQVLLLTSEDKEKDKDADKVSLMTIHAAKGLEFPYVYVVGMEEELFPSPLSTTNRRDLEEERRLFYVAVTRAEKQLTLSYAMSRFQYGNISSHRLSRFVEEIDPKYMDVQALRNNAPINRMQTQSLRPTVNTQSATKRPPINNKTTPTMANSPAEIAAIKVGMNVMHSKFGIGKVIALEGTGAETKAIVFFDTAGQKQLMLKFAKLAIVEQ